MVSETALAELIREKYRFPRVSGDEPCLMMTRFWACAFSPRERG